MPEIGSDAGRCVAGAYQRITDLLGGRRVFDREVTTQLEAHTAIKDGLPVSALRHLVTHLRVLEPASIERAVGVSVRPHQRRKGAPEKLLSWEQGGRIWTGAEVLVRATDVFGSQEEAERWLDRPAMGLNDNRPLDLLDAPAGVAIVEDFLIRVEHCVYT